MEKNESLALIRAAILRLDSGDIDVPQAVANVTSSFLSDASYYIERGIRFGFIEAKALELAHAILEGE